METVVDLMQQVLRPLAEERGLATWEALAPSRQQPWFPSRIAFGKFKGRSFREAMERPGPARWLDGWPASENPRSAEMGRWYLEQLRVETPDPPPESVVFESGLSDDSELVLFRDPELETLRQLIAGARARLADLEAEYTQERHGVEVVQAQLFALLRPHYQRRDALWLQIQYRRRYLDTLLTEGEEEAEAVKPEYEHARAETEREYRGGRHPGRRTKALSDEEEQELKGSSQAGAALPPRPLRLPQKAGVLPTSDAGDQSGSGPRRHRASAGDRQRPEGFLMRQG